MKISDLALKARFTVGGYAIPGSTLDAALELFRTPINGPRKHWEDGVEARAERATTTQGISYLRWTPAQTTARLLALHGWSGRATQFGPMAHELLSHGVETIAIDGPGHGASAGRYADPVVFANALAHACDELDPFDVGVGHSMGGGALALALSRGLDIKKAILIASPASFADVATKFSDSIGLPGRLLPRFLALVGAASGLSIEQADITEAARSISVPAMIIHDRNDDETSYQNAERIHGAWDNSLLLLTSGLGHRAVLRDPAVLDEIADFVSD